MTNEINKSDINHMNKIIFKKINAQFEKDLTPSEFISTARYISGIPGWYSCPVDTN